MNDINTVYIERNNCGDCYRCVRNCAIKAIKIEDFNAEIIDEMCVNCGMCINCCPVGVIKFRDDVWLSRKLIEQSDLKVVASLSPSWVTEFPGVSSDKMIEALKELGFDHISESALGAQLVAEQEFEYLKTRSGIHISSRCPAINDFICKYKPKLAANIIPVYSPMLAHGKMLKEIYGEATKVIHISSCIASKKECDAHKDLVDVSLTFRELQAWMNDKSIVLKKMSGGSKFYFQPHPARRALSYPLEKGNEIAAVLKERRVNNVKIMSKSGLYNIDKLLRQVPVNENDETIYLDLLACENGCIQSCGIIEDRGSIIDKELLLLQEIDRRHDSQSNYKLPFIQAEEIIYKPIHIDDFVSEPEVIKALNSIGIYTPQEELNCNGCGYMNCRRFAKALVQRHVHARMCTHYLRREFEDKFTILLAKMPSGVMVVDKDLCIVESNRNLATLLGTNVEMEFESNPGMNGRDITTIVPFHKLVASVLESGDDQLERDVQVKDKLMKVSIFTVQRHHLVLVIARDMFHAEVRNEEIVTRTKQVIKENLMTVQKIANLLGDNASRTESILNSILKSYTEENVE